MTTEQEPGRTPYHQFFGAIQVAALTKVDLEVYLEMPMAPQPPVGDVIIIRPVGDHWTEKQRELLPDGIRDTDADTAIIELKVTESVNDAAMRQAVMLLEIYCRSKNLLPGAVKLFLASARKTKQKQVARLGFVAAKKPGVYWNQIPWLEDIGLISLNDLASEPHNALFKFFASRQREKEAAFSLLEKMPIVKESLPLVETISGLAYHWFGKGVYGMEAEELTLDKVQQMGRRWRELVAQSLTLEERLQGLRPEERLQGLRPEERLQGLRPEEIEAYLAKLKQNNGDGQNGA